MSEQPVNNVSESDSDVKADVKAILVIFATALVMAMHFVSGFTLDI
ncbi:MAG: hypothetical protein ACI9UU_000894 [Candidatus Azotimanducaceae bacterium]|jgi:hypothetical protein